MKKPWQHLDVTVLRVPFHLLQKGEGVGDNLGFELGEFGVNNTNMHMMKVQITMTLKLRVTAATHTETKSLLIDDIQSFRFEGIWGEEKCTIQRVTHLVQNKI